MPFARYAWSVLGVNLFVIVWGAFVRASGSGAGCGRHWPLCNGTALPRGAQVPTLIEFTHRVTSGLALVLVVALYWWARRAFAPGHRARRAAAWSVLFIVVEALVGAGLVLLGLVGDNDSMARAGYLAFHLLNTFLLIGAITLTAVWSRHQAPLVLPTRGAVPWLAGAGLFLLALVAMTGAVTALGDTLFPAASLAEGFRADSSPTAHLLVRLRVLHPIAALLTGAYLSAMVWVVVRKRPGAAELPWGRRLTGLAMTQLVVGFTNLLLLAPTVIQLAHLLVADLLWIAQVGFTATALSAAPVAAAANQPEPVSRP